MKNRLLEDILLLITPREKISDKTSNYSTGFLKISEFNVPFDIPLIFLLELKKLSLIPNFCI